MIAFFDIKKSVFYIFTIYIGQAIIFLYQSVAATPTTPSLSKETPLPNFSSSAQPIKAPVTPNKITNNPKQILARINNEIITVQDVENVARNLPKELKNIPKEILYPQLVKQLIVDRALMINIQKDGIEKHPLVQKEIKLATQEFIQKKLSQVYFIEKLQPFLTPQSIQNYYNKHYLNHPPIPEIHLRQIIVQTSEIAQIVLKKLQEGQSFANLARIYSIDLYNRKEKAGDIGWFELHNLPSSITKEISSLENDAYTKIPIETDYGWVIFQKLGERNRPVPSLDSVKSTIKEKITKEEITNLYEQSLKKVHIIEY